MMVTHYSCALSGLEPRLVRVEVDLSDGLPHFDIVGLPDSTVCEARQRVRSAIKNSGFDFPVQRITVNLAPADLPKEGSGFDLAMALGILRVSGQFPAEASARFLMVGELGLDGGVRPVPGVLAMAGLGRDNGLQKFIVPLENSREAAIFENLKIWPVGSLSQAAGVLTQEPPPLEEKPRWTAQEEWPEDFCEVKGQENVKRAMEIAAAGNHNILVMGPPGSGKTMLARRFPGILPAPAFAECVEIAKIRSVAGFLKDDPELSVRRPFRAPHSSISYAGMTGGGHPIRPGEVTLAHGGVLFMDEMPLFHRDVLESLRQPLEDKRVTVARASGFVHYPADFLLLAAMNPCPCGFYGDLRRCCACSVHERIRYRKRISGPVLDRVDLHVEISAVAHETLYEPAAGEKSAEIKKRVEAAREIQRERFGRSKRANASMSQNELEKHCRIGLEGRRLLKSACDRLYYSARGYSKILKTARTIADLAGSGEIQILHLAEALQYRVLDRGILHE